MGEAGCGAQGREKEGPGQKAGNTYNSMRVAISVSA